MGDPFRRDPRKRPINPNFHRYPGGTAPKQFRGPRGRARFPPPRDIERDRYYPAGRITPPFPPPFLDPYDDPRFPLPPPLPPFDDPYFPLPPPCIYDDPYDVPPLLPPLLPRPRRGSPPLLFPDHKLHVDSRRSPEDHCGQPPLEHNNQDFTEDIDLTQIDAKRKAGSGRENGVPRGRGQVRGRGHSAIQGRPAGRGQLGFRGQSVDEDQGQSSGRDQTGVVGQPAIRGQFAGRGRGHMALGGQAQQGQPENVRGRGRGRGGGQSVKKPVAPMSVPVAPVNSMALVGDVANSSTAEKLQKFILKLKDFPEKENSIQTIENCITASHLSLKTQFNVEDVDTQILNRPIFSGTLYINDVFIARATSTGKKLLKHSVFDSALQLLKTRSVAEIMAQADTGPSVEHIREPTFQSPKVEMGEDDLRTKLLKLQNKIRTSKQPDNQPVMLLDVAFLESRCGLTHNCEVEPMRTERGIHLYTKAKVIIEGKLIASAVALSKKESKARAYQKTVDLFLNLEVDSILKEHFYKEEPKEEIPLEIQELIKKHKEKQLSQKPPAALTEQEVGDLLDRLISDLASQPRDGVNTIMNVDKNVVQMKIKLLAVYKIVRSPEFYISCDLYIVDRFIAQGKGTTRRQAQIDAYVKGAEILKKSKGSDVLTSFPKFDDAELKRTDIMDIVYKGYAKTFESNLCRLNRLKQLPEDKRKVSELIIIEHSDWVKDRMKHAHCILNQSATQCGCLLEWTTEPEGVCFRCTMKLQGVQLTTAVARTRKHALAVASSIALFKFYETQPVIQGFHTDYPKVWITREDILRIAQDLPDCSSDTPEISADAKQQVDPKLALAIEKKLDQFFSQPTVEDFVAAPDWKLEEKRHLRHMASTRNLRVTSEIFCEEQLTVVCKKHDLLQMLNILEQQPNKCQGRYRILPNEEKPSYNDITGEIAANESLVKQFQGGADLIEKDKQAGVECLEDDMEIENDNENEMNLSVNSEDDDAFVTANNTFVEDKPVAKTTICTTNTTPTFTLSDIPLPKSTSTPSRTPGAVNNGGPVQKGVSKSQKSKSSSRWDKTSSKPKPGKSTTKNTTTDNNNHATTVFPHRNQPLPSPSALAGYSSSPTSMPGSNTGTPSPVLAEPERRPSDPSSARLSEGIWTDSSTYSSPGDQRQFPTADQWLQQQQMQQQQHLQQQAQQQQLQQQQQQQHQQHLPQHQLQHPHSMDGFNAERGQETQSWSQWAGTNYGNQWGQPRQFPIANQNSDIQKQQWIGQQQQQQQHLQQQPQQHLQQPQQLLQQPQQHQQQDFQNGVWTTPGAILGYNNRYSY